MADMHSAILHTQIDIPIPPPVQLVVNRYPAQLALPINTRLMNNTGINTERPEKMLALADSSSSHEFPHSIVTMGEIDGIQTIVEIVDGEILPYPKDLLPKIFNKFMGCMSQLQVGQLSKIPSNILIPDIFKEYPAKPAYQKDGNHYTLIGIFINWLYAEEINQTFTNYMIGINGFVPNKELRTNTEEAARLSLKNIRNPLPLSEDPLMLSLAETTFRIKYINPPAKPGQLFNIVLTEI